MELFCECMNWLLKNWKDIVIFTTFLALLYQLWCNTKAINLNTEANELTKKMILKNTQIRELELMPKKYFIMNTQGKLETYLKEIKGVIYTLEKIKKTPDNDNLVEEIYKYHREKEGLLKKHKNTPVWLTEIEEAATQYYIVIVWNFSKLDSRISKRFAEDMIIRAKESQFYIQELLEYVNEMIPNVILNCPAAINERDFYK